MEIKTNKFGRGVYATGPYQVGEIIETCPVIILSVGDTKKINSTLLYDYYYSWGANNSQAAIALGYGSLYNHSYKPNAQYIKNLANDVIEFVSIKPISKGDEILINYNGEPSNQAPLWFDADPEG